MLHLTNNNNTAMKFGKHILAAAKDQERTVSEKEDRSLTNNFIAIIRSKTFIRTKAPIT